MTTNYNNIHGLLPQRFVDRVRDAAKIVDVVGDFAELHRRGKDWHCLCPFHDDRHLGNVSVSEARNVFSCFSCGKVLNPISFVMEVRQCSFREAVLYLANKYYIHDTEVMEYKSPIVNICRKPRPPKAIYHFRADEIPTNSNANNPLFQYLKGVFQGGAMWESFQEVIKKYSVCTSGNSGTYGWTIYPSIDADGNYLTAKYMRYGNDGRRVKTDAEGKGAYSINWLHTMREKEGLLSLGGSEIGHCLFGLHLLNRYPTAVICVCESEKTAIIAQTFYNFDSNLFMATGGKNRLTLQFLQPLIDSGRKVLLYPDIDAFGDWEGKAKAITERLQQRNTASNIRITQKLMDWYDPIQDGEKADIADILLRIYENRRKDPAQLAMDTT